MSQNYNKVPELTAEKAYRLYNEEGLSYAQIAEQFSDENESISHVTVRNRVKAYEDGKETGKKEVTSNPKEYGLKELIEDEETENQFEHTCPNCEEIIEPPNSPGESDCSNCGVTLSWSKDEI
jgi:transposase